MCSDHVTLEDKTNPRLCSTPAFWLSSRHSRQHPSTRPHERFTQRPSQKDQSQEKKKVSVKKGSPNGSLTCFDLFFPQYNFIETSSLFSVHSRSPSPTYRDPKKTSTAWDTKASWENSPRPITIYFKRGNARYTSTSGK